MLLAIDCGNTNTMFSIWDGDKFIATWRTATEWQRTADQYYVWLTTLMRFQDVNVEITDVVVSSTVPRVVFNLRVFADRYFNCRPLVVGKPDCALPVDVRVDAGTAVGPDRLVNTVAGYDLYGGNLIVDNAVYIADGFRVSKTIIGLTIVAVGTSLPEIATVVVATYRGHPEVAIGNVLGSNVFNVFAVMGASALAGPIGIASNLKVFDFWVMLLSSLVLLLYVLRRQPIGRKTGGIFTLAYIAYVLVVIFLAPNM